MPKLCTQWASPIFYWPLQTRTTTFLCSSQQSFRAQPIFFYTIVVCAAIQCCPSTAEAGPNLRWNRLMTHTPTTCPCTRSSCQFAGSKEVKHREKNKWTPVSPLCAVQISHILRCFARWGIVCELFFNVTSTLFYAHSCRRTLRLSRSFFF